MKTNWKVLVIFALAAVLMSTVLGANALTNVSIHFTGQYGAEGPDCNYAWFYYVGTGFTNNDDGDGYDYFAIITFDANGVVLDNDMIAYAPTGFDISGYSETSDIGISNSITARPIHVVVYDTPMFPILSDENAPDAINWVLSNGAVVAASDEFDPGAFFSPCASVPLTAQCPAIPAGSVVGDLPFATRAYYSPGNLSSVTVNVGTYWVIGQDESGQYYKIILACQYLWIPVGNMQPSYQAPQNGAPLPTRVVS